MSRIDMIAPSTTTPATSRTSRSSLSGTADGGLLVCEGSDGVCVVTFTSLSGRLTPLSSSYPPLELQRLLSPRLSAARDGLVGGLDEFAVLRLGLRVVRGFEAIVRDQRLD